MLRKEGKGLLRIQHNSHLASSLSWRSVLFFHLVPFCVLYLQSALVLVLAYDMYGWIDCSQTPQIFLFKNLGKGEYLRSVEGKENDIYYYTR